MCSGGGSANRLLRHKLNVYLSLEFLLAFSMQSQSRRQCVLLFIVDFHFDRSVCISDGKSVLFKMNFIDVSIS